MKTSKLLIVWFCWIVAVVLFAFATFLAPDDGIADQLTAPEFFLCALAACHLIGGAVLLVVTFMGEQDNP